MGYGTAWIGAKVLLRSSPGVVWVFLWCLGYWYVHGNGGTGMELGRMGRVGIDTGVKILFTFPLSDRNYGSIIFLG